MSILASILWRLRNCRAFRLAMMLTSTLNAEQCLAGPVEILANGCSINQQWLLLNNLNLSISVRMNRGAVCQIQFTVPYHYVKFDIINKSKSGFIGLGQAMPFGLVKTGYGEQWRKQLSLIYRPQSSFAGRDAFAVELGALGAPQTDHKNEDRFGAVGSVTTALYFEVAVQ